MCRKMLGKYDKSFWLFAAVMIGMAIVIMFINNYATVSVRELSEDADSHIAALEEELINIQKESEQYGRILDKFADEDDGVLLEKEAEVIQSQLIKSSTLISDSYFVRESEAATHAGYGKWESTWNRETSSPGFVYIRPVFSKERYIGYTGTLVSQTAVKEQIDRLWEGHEWDYFLFMKDEAENFLKNLSKNEKKVYTYKELDTGMLYVEVHKPLKRTRYSNEMIMLISIFAIGAMWMIQPGSRSGKTLFDRSADLIMKDYQAELTSLRRQGNRATIALNIGMFIAILADVGYSIALGRDVKTLLEYLLFCFFSFIILVIYKYSKSGITEQMATGTILLGFICSMAEHISTGGFQAGRAGESFLWFLICLYFGLFILGVSKSRYIFQVFAVLLFLDVLLEMILYQKVDYEDNYLFAIGFILLGCALYIAMEIYVSSAAGHYNKKQELIEEIKTNQALLMQKEKLSSLGQLISGVSYEINTPIGAIKATAETMDSLFTVVIEEVLDAAEELTGEEYDAFLELVTMTLQSMGKMESTLEVRKAKREIIEYFRSIELGEGEQIGEYLGQLEIVDLKLIKERIALFQMEHILDILQRITRLTAFTSGIPTVIYASDAVTKIVTALKSYIYTSGTNERLEFNLIENIENVLILYHKQIKGRINVIRKYDNSCCMILGSPDELAQVWTNLIQNAIQAMKNSRELTIAVKEYEDSVEVTMEPFFAGKDKEGENELGFSITKRVIEKHHGEMKVEEQPGKESIMHVLLKKYKG